MSCSDCTAVIGCGWCRSRQQCVYGEPDGPIASGYQCVLWDFFGRNCSTDVDNNNNNNDNNGNDNNSNDNNNNDNTVVDSSCSCDADAASLCLGPAVADDAVA